MRNSELHSWKFNLAKSVPSYVPSKMLVAEDNGLVADRWEVVWYWLYFEIVEMRCAKEIEYAMWKQAEFVMSPRFCPGWLEEYSCWDGEYS